MINSHKCACNLYIRTSYNILYSIYSILLKLDDNSVQLLMFYIGTLILEVPASPCNPTPNSYSPFWSKNEGFSPGTLHEVALIPIEANLVLICLPTVNKSSILSPRLASAPNIYKILWYSLIVFILFIYGF